MKNKSKKKIVNKKHAISMKKKNQDNNKEKVGKI